MNRTIRSSRLAAVVVGAMATSALYVSACGSDRTLFIEDRAILDTDAAPPTPECARRCSLDGRSVIQTCTGEVLETCADDRACGAGVCQEPCAATAADKSSNGCDFYLQPPAPAPSKTVGSATSRACYAAYVVNRSTLPVEMTLELDGRTLDLSKAVYRASPGAPSEIEPHSGPVPPGESVIVYISDLPPDSPRGDANPQCPDGVVPATFESTLPQGTGRGRSFHLTTTAPVALSAIYPAAGGGSATTTATLLLPVPMWGKENIVVNAWSKITNAFYFSGKGPAAQIVASEADTDVTIHPSRAIEDGAGLRGAPAGIPVTYRLAKGEVLQLNQADELTGSFVESTEPVAVFGGHECMFIPSDVAACDYAQQQLAPPAQWGSEYAAIGHRPREENEFETTFYRIVAARDGTRLDYDPPTPPSGAPLTLAAGELATFSTGVGEPFVVRTQDADHPIYVATYMTGCATTQNNLGDAEFVNVVPAQQYQNSYSFYADPTYKETSITLVRRKTGGEFRDVWLECAGVLDGWQPIGIRGEYEWRRVALSRNRGPGDAFDGGTCTTGLQRLRSDGEFTATLWGMDAANSYAYPGGTAGRTLSTLSFAPVR